MSLADRARVPLVVLMASVLAACGGRAALPEPGSTRGVAPDLRGLRVLLLPVQQNLGVAGDPDAELAYGLRERGQGVMWISAVDVKERMARSPGTQARTRGLPVGVFLQAEVDRVGDPLYGELRRTAALVSAEAVVLPVQAALASTPGEDPRGLASAVEEVARTLLWYVGG
ncbi:MAG: hypothetical protein EXR91_07290 [Gemmatimonadetes bacterium]|nr:hypothetical protein [Gemmatimonadota bacterium]